MKDGEEQPVFTYAHDITMQIRVEDKSHSVTEGISDFEIIDEDMDELKSCRRFSFTFYR